MISTIRGKENTRIKNHPMSKCFISLSMPLAVFVRNGLKDKWDTQHAKGTPIYLRFYWGGCVANRGNDSVGCQIFAPLRRSMGANPQRMSTCPSFFPADQSMSENHGVRVVESTAPR